MESDKSNFRGEAYQTALARIEKLVDAQSFSQIGAFVSDANVIGGFATIDDRACYIYSQSGQVNAAHAKKISQIYKMAISMGYPVIAILDSAGVALDQSMCALAAYGEIFHTMADASGVIAQYSIIAGKCMGIAAVISGLSDFTFATKESRLFIQSPATVDDVKSVGLDKLFSPEYHSKTSGAVQFLYENEDACAEGFKNFFSFVPGNNLENAPIILGDEQQVSLDEQALEQANSAAAVDIEKVVSALVDDGEYVEAGKGYGQGVRTYLARIDGFSVAIISNSGNTSGSDIKKITKFVSFSDAFNIPIVCLSDVGGFDSTVLTQSGIIQDAAALAYVWANATVPKINIILKEATGSAFLLFNSKYIGADLVYAWPNASVGVLNAGAAAKVLEGAPAATDSALESGYVDDVIEPIATRAAILKGIEILLTKRVFKHPKKHGSVCF